MHDAAEVQAFFDWIVTRQWADLPPNAQRRTALILADDIAAALSAADEPEPARARRAIGADTAGPGTASLLVAGRPQRPLLQAAMLNGLTMGWNELDEGYRKAVCHGGLYVLPALLAVAEAEGAPLQDLLRATALGYEIVARVAATWRFAPMRIHPHALLGPLGAAAGVGLLRRLPAPALLSAVTGAATAGMAGPYSQAVQGVLARNTWAAQGAAAGLHALDWAAAGIGGNARSLHEVYVTALGASEDLTALAPHAQAGWAVESGYSKVHACCQYVHSSIEAVQAVLQQAPQLRGGAEIAAVEVQAHPLALTLNDAAPRTTLGAKFSLAHAVAAALVHGDGGVASFDAASLKDGRIARLRQRVHPVPYADLQPWPHDRPARVTVTTEDGQRFAALCLSAMGGPDRPHPESAIWAKVQALTAAQPGLADGLRQVFDAAQQAAGCPDLQRPWRDWLDTLFAPPPAAAPLA